jgi:hypothetical protein
MLQRITDKDHFLYPYAIAFSAVIHEEIISDYNTRI